MQPAPPLKVSQQVINMHAAAKHHTATHQKQTALAAKNASAAHTRGGYKKKQRGAGTTVPTLSVASGPPKSSPNSQSNMKHSLAANQALMSAATNDSKVQAPKCGTNQAGGGSATQLGKFLESLYNMDKSGGYKKRRSKKKRRRRRKRRRHTKRKRRRRHLRRWRRRKTRRRRKRKTCRRRR